MNSDKISLRIGVLNDHPFFVEAIRSLLKDHGEPAPIVSASNPEIALSLFTKASLTVLMIDLDLPKMSGLVFTRRFRELDRLTRLIWISDNLCPAYIEEGRKLGVLGFLSHRADASQTLEALQSVARDREYILLPDEPLCHSSFVTTAGPGLEALTLEQTAALKAVAQGKSAKEAADALGVSQRTIESRLARARHSLGFNKITELTLWGKERGL
jgi:DNA-binding NarL/FixJ family response regulator